MAFRSPSSGHIGIAHATISFLSEKFKNKQVHNVSGKDVMDVLHSVDLINFISSHYRGIPNLHSFTTVVNNQQLSAETKTKMRQLMDNVASGIEVRAKDPSRSPGSAKAVDLLLSLGFLHEDCAGILHFASQVHHTIWVNSNRTDPLPHLVTDSGRFEFLVAAIRRMRASALAQFDVQNVDLLEVGLYMRSHIQELEGVSEILLLMIVISLLFID
jgi:hypothetical protein